MSIYQFKVTLRGLRPPVWRRFQTSDDISFYKLHLIIQEVMGWYNAHLYNFDLGHESFSDAETAREFGGKNAERSKMNQYVRQEGQKFLYEYDFGDSWEHEVLLEKIMQVEPGANYPRCLKGKRACPPEDVGGVWGYEEFLEAIQNPDHAEHEMYVEWMGDDFDPEEFDLDEVNQRLAGLR